MDEKEIKELITSVVKKEVEELSGSLKNNTSNDEKITEKVESTPKSQFDDLKGYIKKEIDNAIQILSINAESKSKEEDKTDDSKKLSGKATF